MHRKMIIDKVASVLDVTAANDPGYDERLTSLLDSAGRIFIAGAGRSALVARFFAMRLMHGGYNVSMVGEVVTPSICIGDLLIAISGSGETETMIAYAKRAKKLGAQVILLSTTRRSTIGDLADEVFLIGTPDTIAKIKGMPMGTVFELSTLILLEGIISHIIHDKGIEEEDMRTRHANLE